MFRFRQACIGFYPSDEDTNKCDHYMYDGTCSFFWNERTESAIVCDDIIEDNRD